MKVLAYFIFFATLVFPLAARSQQKVSKAQEIVQSALAYQNKLQDSTATIDDVIWNWSNTASNSEVRKDPDAQAIAFGCEAIVEIQKKEDHKADSLFRKAMPLFKYRSSKSSILVAYAEFERGIKKNADAMRAYDEIVNTMDSVGALWEISYYRRSGYAPYAYAIDASFGMEQIASSDPSQKKKAVELLNKTMNRHPYDALGMMTIVALHRLGALDDEAYKFKVDLLCSQKPDLRKANDLFERKFTEAGKQ
jgi:hypothetical protein